MTAPLTPAPWIDNTGTVPDGVEADTVIEVEYRDGYVTTWVTEDCVPPSDPDLWPLRNNSLDVIRWRKVQP